MAMRDVIGPLVLVLTLLIGTAAGVAAQEEPTVSSMNMAGLEKTYGRSFAADMTAMMDPASPEALPSGWWVLTTVVFAFESEGTATAGVETIREQTASGGDAALQDIELNLDGMSYSAHRAEDEQGGVTTSMVMVTAQAGPFVYAVVGLAFNEDPAPLVESVTLSMRDAEVSDDEELFHEDGTSTGGLWAKLPTVEAVTAQAAALTVAGDAVYYPPTAATLAA